MKKFYTIAMALAVSLAGASSGLACDNSSFTLNSHTDLGGDFTNTPLLFVLVVEVVVQLDKLDFGL
jgi:hypothetical protein